MARNFHVDDSTKGSYAMILGRDLLTELGSNLKLPEYNIEADDGPLKKSLALIVDFGTYEFKDSNT